MTDFSHLYTLNNHFEVRPSFLKCVNHRQMESTHRLLYIAFCVMFIAIWLDSIGVQLGL